MKLSIQALAAFAATVLATSTYAQVNFPESEPNSVKTEANAVTGMVSGDTISGLSSGTTATAGTTTAATVDMFRVRTAALPVGIYKHTLTLTTAGQTATTGHTGTIRGLTQSAGGVITTTDTAFQTSTTGAAAPFRANHWFGFGLQEEIYYRVHGAAATTNAYTATLSTATVSPVVVPGTFAAGTITITTIGQTTQDTEIFVYDSTGNPMPGYKNDDEGPVGPTTQSRLIRTYPAGTYFLAVSDLNTANNLSDANPDEDFQTSNVLDFPNALVSSDRDTASVDYDFTITDGGPVVPVTLSGNGEYDIGWATFTVTGALPPPANDACASATVITSAASGIITAATNDGTATCDPGGATSRDVWYSYTVPAGATAGGTFSANTCGSSLDTVLSVYSACGGTELACSDNCGGTPCGANSSCVSLTTLVASQTVLIRVSDKGLGGVFYNIAVSFLVANDECTAPIAITAGTHPFDTSFATTGTQGQGFITPCGSSVKRDLWYTYTPGVTGTATVQTCGTLITSTNNDSKIAYHLGAGCPSAANPAGCDDDGCTTPTLGTLLNIPVTCGQVITLQVGQFSTTAGVFVAGSFQITETGTSCSTPSVTFCDGSLVGTHCVLCGNNGTAGRGCGNFNFNQGALLGSSGIASTTADTLVLTCTEIPGPGLFFQANGLGGPFGFGDGSLCASVGIARMGVVFPVAGSASYPGGTTPFPISSFGAAPGDTKHYQCWYRDSEATWCPTATFNISNGISLVWQ